jgi:chaperonin GroEL
MEEPIRQIVANAGQEGAIVVQNILAKKDLNYGYNARTEIYADLYKDGVIDPTKVTRTALENAASVSGLMLMTEVVITDSKDDKEDAMPAMPPGGGMPGMY